MESELQRVAKVIDGLIGDDLESVSWTTGFGRQAKEWRERDVLMVAKAVMAEMNRTPKGSVQ